MTIVRITPEEERLFNVHRYPAIVDTARMTALGMTDHSVSGGGVDVFAFGERGEVEAHWHNGKLLTTIAPPGLEREQGEIAEMFADA